MTENIRKFLKTLGLDSNIGQFKVKDINKAFRKLAITLHPDKAGQEHTTAFIELRHAHEFLVKYLRETGCANAMILMTMMKRSSFGIISRDLISPSKTRVVFYLFYY